MAATESETGATASLHVALFDQKKMTLRVIDQPTEPRADLAAVMEKENCLAGVNGGYFDPNHAPVGLLTSDGRTIAPLRKARLLSGILSVAKGRLRLQRMAEFLPKSKVRAAIQAGPFLIDHTRPVPGLNDTRPARRTFVATSAAPEAAIGYCSAVSLAQLARILAAIENGNFKIERALNLDGGSSSAFWCANDGRPFSISEQKTVRDFVGIVPR